VMVAEVRRACAILGGRPPPVGSCPVFWKQYPHPRLQSVLVSTVSE
jgi:hypothetical protein